MALRDRIRTAWRNRYNPTTLLRHSHLTCSQYGEDLVFSRLMQPGTNGTFVDVGSHHPINGSNSYSLYAHGWRGITIDPNPLFADIFRKDRPEDIHLVEGVSIDRGELTYFQFEDDVFNTLSRERADQLVNNGQHIIQRTQVPCRPLASIVDEHLKNRHIDLLTVDCEGLDLDVLKSIDLSVRRPTVIMVEDYPSLYTLRNGEAPKELQLYLKDFEYSPIAHTGWTSILAANDWRTLFDRSDAFSADKVSNGYLPD